MMMPTAMKAAVANKVAKAQKPQGPLGARPRGGASPPILPAPRGVRPVDPKPPKPQPNGGGTDLRSNPPGGRPIIAQPPVPAGGAPVPPGAGPQGGAQQPFGGYTPQQMQGAGVLGMGRYNPNAVVNPGDLGPGTVTGPTQRLNTPAGNLAPPEGNTPNTPNGFSSILGDGGGPAGADDGGYGAGQGPTAPQGTTAADMMERQLRAHSADDAFQGLKDQAAAGYPNGSYQDAAARAMSMLPPRLAAQVKAGKMTLGGALNRHKAFLSGQLGPQQPQGL